MSDARFGTPLTRRETEALMLSARGNCAKGVARGMGITPRTATYYLRMAKARLGAKNRTHAVAIALTERRIAYP